MFRLLRFLVGLAFLAGFIWFGSSVELGRYTLFGHLQRIWRADETQELVEGAREKLRETTGSLQGEPSPGAAPAPDAQDGPMRKPAAP